MASSSRYIIVDANAFIYAVNYRLDLNRAILELKETVTPVTLSCVLKELEGLVVSGRSSPIALRVARSFLKLEFHGSGDECIINAALKTGAAVLTNDRALTALLKSKLIRTFALRQQKIIR